MKIIRYSQFDATDSSVENKCKNKRTFGFISTFYTGAEGGKDSKGAQVWNHMGVRAPPGTTGATV